MFTTLGLLKKREVTFETKPNSWCEHNIHTQRWFYDADRWDLHWVVLVLVVLVLTLGMGSGVQWWGGGGTGHHGLLGAHAGPGGRRRQTEKPPRKASNQSAPIHRRQHGDPNRTGGGGAEMGRGQEKQGVSQAGSPFLQREKMLRLSVWCVNW